MKCPKCHFDNPADTRFCGNCAAPLLPAAEIPVSQTETLKTPIKELTTGSTFAGRYQVIEELGKGGMGKVYRVLDKKLKEEVALKLIKPEIASDKETIERFSNELKLARKIGHRNVGRMYELMEDEGTHFITMEYVPGENLKSTIRRIGQLPVGKSIAIAKQICEGLEEAHRLGIVHRDLKPSNIILDAEGDARIMDFGIARSLKAKGITGEGVIIGTPEYMSPEQVEGKDVDQRSDIYSVGVILYEMVTGRVPFSGDTPLTVAVKQKTEAPQDPSKLNAQVPESLCRVILKCLEKAKEKRYQSAEELHSELTRIDEEIPTAERAERAVPPKKRPKSKEIAAGEGKIRWKKIAIWGGAAVLLALIIYAGLNLFTSRKEVIDSIAVLPFENVNADPNTDYLCDGITETIINKLSQLSNIRVIARNSVFTYKGKTVDPKKAGQELDVKAILLTRLVRVGDRLTISPTLVRTRDNSQLWGERYNRKFDDIFAIEEEMATSIIQALRMKLSGEEKHKIAMKPIDNAAAYEYYLRATYEVSRFTEDGLDRAVQYLQSGIDIIGDNALLYSGLARVYYRYVDLGYKQEDYISKADEYVKKALSLDPDFPKAHFVLGSISRDFRGKPKEAILHYKKALDVDPNESEALSALGYYYDLAGKASASRLVIERLKRLDPLNKVHNHREAAALFWDGQFGPALAQYAKLYQGEPESLYYQMAYSNCLIYNNQLQEAFLIIDRMVKANPNNIGTKWVLLLEYALLKEEKKAYELMTPDFYKTCKRDPIYSYSLARAFAVLDKRKEALDWLENAVDRGFINYPFLAEKDPFLKNIRGEERFKKLLERVKYEWEHFEE
jgi:serine/threonine protein kinase